MGWSGGWLPLDGVIVGAPSAISRTSQLTQVFARGTDDRLWTRFYAPTQWSNWVRAVPTWQLSSSPAATSMGPDDLYVFAQGKNQALECVWWSADSGWHGPVNFDGKIVGAPTAVVRAAGLCDVFARAPDDTLWQISLVKGAKLAVGWRQVSATWKLSSSPSAGSMNEHHVGVFAQGKDQGLESMRWEGVSGWHGPENHGGKIKDAPSVVYRKPGVCDVFARASTDRLFEISWVDGTMIDWREVPEVTRAADADLGENHAGNTLTSSPAADTMGPDHVHIFARGSDNALWQKWWVGTGAPTVHLHFRAIATTGFAPPALSGIPQMVKSMRQSYAGVWIDVVDFSYLDEPKDRPGLLALLDTFDAGTCTMPPGPSGPGFPLLVVISQDQGDLFSLGGDVDNKHLVVYFVSSMAMSDGTPLFGCATHGGEKGAAVLIWSSPPDVLAHEMGHVLGLLHCDAQPGPYLPRRTMSTFGANVALPGDLAPEEFSKILGSGYIDFA